MKDALKTLKSPAAICAIEMISKKSFFCFKFNEFFFNALKRLNVYCKFSTVFNEIMEEISNEILGVRHISMEKAHGDYHTSFETEDIFNSKNIHNFMNIPQTPDGQTPINCSSTEPS